MKQLKKYEKIIEYLYFPALLGYLELVFHIYMGLDMSYIAVFESFAAAVGLLLTVMTGWMPKKIRKILRTVLTLIISVLFCAQIICKDILQQYYQPFGAMNTAAGNHLDDYIAVIKESLVENWSGLLLLMVIPAVFCVLMLTRTGKEGKGGFLHLRGLVLSMTGCIAFYLVCLGMIQHYPWQGDFTPKMLYETDMYTDDQVEQLGVIAMVCLDGKHTLFGTKRTMDIELDEISDEQEQQSAKIEEVIDTSPNVMNIDLQKWIDGAPNEDVKWLSQYFQSVSPTRKNKYTGMCEGYNVIFVTAEGFSGYMIDETLTPTLYRLTQEGFVFDHFYTALHFTSTSGGEFQNLTGLYPKSGFPISMTETGKKNTYLPFTLAHVLNGKGYTSTGYHFNQNMYGRALSHPNLGYNWRQASDCANPITKETTEDGTALWPQSDDYMIAQTMQDYIGTEPFHVYYLTLSGHLPYGFGSNKMSVRNQEAVSALPYSDKTKSYLAANLELEKALSRLVSELEKAGIAERTLLVMAPDHIPYSDLDVLSELAGRTFGTDSLESLNEQSVDFDVYKSALVIWSGSMKERVEIHKPCCQVDILPTVLNLLGAEYDSRMLAGTDILSDSEGLVIFSSHSWRTEKGTYNRFTGEFTLTPGVTMGEKQKAAYVDRMKTVVACRLAITPLIIENDYYRMVLGTE